MQQLDLFGNIINAEQPKTKVADAAMPTTNNKINEQEPEKKVIQKTEIGQLRKKPEIIELVAPQSTTNNQQENILLNKEEFLLVKENLDIKNVVNTTNKATNNNVQTPILQIEPKISNEIAVEVKPIIFNEQPIKPITVYEDLIKRKRGRPRKERPLIVIPKIKQKRGRKSFAEISTNLDLVNIPSDDELELKQYYTISTVANWFNVNNSQIRLWENQFEILTPKKNKKGDRLFRPEDVRNLKIIYHLLRQRKFSVEGAKEYLKANQSKSTADVQLKETLLGLKSFLLELKATL